MQFSSPSPTPCTISKTLLPQKIIHKQAKKKPPRRRRINACCGLCLFYVHPECPHGLSHGGITYPHPKDYECILRRPPQPNIVKTGEGLGDSNSSVSPSLPDKTHVQPQPSQSLGTTEMLAAFEGLDDLDDCWSDIRSI
nr:C2 [Soybean yellow leaf curl virus]WIF18855.1 C2 [Soybean stay-green associated virus]WIF18861.1 C2 [Soybean stay-green associated virus]WIF18909.1 C2 [Soybean stay-green associated virus]